MFGTKRKKDDAIVAQSAAAPAQASPQGSTGNRTAPIDMASATPNGAASPAPDDAQRRAAAALRLSSAFTQIVTVLMRSPVHKYLALADLGWLVFPPLLTGQFSVAEVKSKDGKMSAPAAVVLWARVSADVDKRLAENLEAPIRLRPDEWKSGEILWLIETIGDGRIIPGLLKQLAGNAFKGKDVKIRSRTGQGKLVVKSLQAAIAEQETAATRK